MPDYDYSAPAQVGNPSRGWCDAVTVTVPTRLLSSDLGGTTKIVYEVLLMRCGKSYSCECRIDDIAISSGLSYVQAQKQLAMLEQAGLISIRQQYKKPNIYILRLHPGLKSGVLGCLKGQNSKKKNSSGLSKRTRQIILPPSTPDHVRREIDYAVGAILKKYRML